MLSRYIAEAAEKGLQNVKGSGGDITTQVELANRMISAKNYSPTTMYNDYSISENLFHRQSQSTTSETSPTGQRYIHHRERGSRVLLFVREFNAML